MTTKIALRTGWAWSIVVSDEIGNRISAIRNDEVFASSDAAVRDAETWLRILAAPSSATDKLPTTLRVWNVATESVAFHWGACASEVLDEIDWMRAVIEGEQEDPYAY
jgi:hypothetical protein